MAIPVRFKSKLAKFAAERLGNIEGELQARVLKEVNKRIEELIRSCPSPERLAKIAEAANNIKSAVSLFQNGINQINGIASGLKPPIDAAEIIVNLFKANPVPTAIGTPPGPAGGLILATPIGVLNTQSDILDFTKTIIEVLDTEVSNFKIISTGASQSINSVIEKIDTLTNLISQCAEGQSKADLEKTTKLIQGNLDEDTARGEEFIANNGNIYILYIENEKTFEPGLPNRRRAYALTQRGNRSLETKFSYSSSTEVLKQELKFEINKQLS